MTIILTNGTELSPILATGESRYIQNMQRDTLSFVFPVEESLDRLDTLFAPENCETITIKGDDESEYVHKGYTIRAELKRAPVVTQPATEETAEVSEPRITVSMAQRTFQESQLASLVDTVDTLVMDSLA